MIAPTDALARVSSAETAHRAEAAEHPVEPVDSSDGNRFALYTDGDASHDSLLHAIDEAERRVWLETYIFEPDAAGQEVLAALTDAARRGCDVILLIDRFGAKRLKNRHVAALRAAGGAAFWYNPLLPFDPNGKKVTLSGIHRDHRKILIVDEAVAYCGGRNISMAYGGPGPEEFYDVMMRIEGPAAHGLAKVLLETLRDVTDLDRALPARAAPYPEGVPVAVHALDRAEGVDGLDRALVAALDATERACLYCSPYLIPPSDILDALLRTADRGREVRILTAGKSDVPWAKMAGRHLYGRLLERGVRIHELQGTTLHAKFYVMDDRRCFVGSYNADRWGRRYNQEVAVEVLSPDLADDLAACFFDAVENGVDMTEDVVAAWAWYQRALYALLYALSRLVA